jgi:uncharacterized membrane protein YfcA
MMSLIWEVAVLLITGIAVGFASGLLGVGGCFIMIPVQYWVYTAMGINPQTATMIAFGTNLVVVFPTAMSGAYAHSKREFVYWSAAVVLGITGAFGAAIGSCIAAALPKNLLRILFGMAVILGAVRMLTAKTADERRNLVRNPLVWAAWGFPLGIVTGIIGIGGGVLMVPVMVVALGFEMHLAVGTSTALMIFTSLGGIAGYIYNGLRAGIPFNSPIGHLIGYVNIESGLLLAATSVAMAQVGARAANKLPEKKLKYIFVIVMLYMGWKMIESGLGLRLPF